MQLILIGLALVLGAVVVATVLPGLMKPAPGAARIDVRGNPDTGQPRAAQTNPDTALAKSIADDVGGLIKLAGSFFNSSGGPSSSGTETV